MIDQDPLKYFLCHYAIIPNNRFAFLQYSSPVGCFGSVAREHSMKFNVQWQIRNGMSTSSTNFSNTAIIPNDAKSKIMSFSFRIGARINLIRNILPVPSVASKKNSFSSRIIECLHNLIVNACLFKR